MNNETNESNNIINQQKNDNNNSKENGAIINSKNKFKKVKSSVISNNNLYEIATPSRRNLRKIENILKQSLKTKNCIVNKKENDERDINKKNTNNSINHNFQNEQSKKNLLKGSISPKSIRKIKIDDNDNNNEINIINLYKMTDKLYTNDEHFQKDSIIKNKIKDKNSSSNIIKRNKFMSGRMNNMFQKKKLIITFGLNEGNINFDRKQSFIKNNDKNFLFNKGISNISKGFDSELSKSQEKNNFSSYLNLNQRFRSPPKEINENSKGINNSSSKHKHESNKNYALHYCRTNNDKNNTRRNSQFFREKTSKSIKHIESPKKIKEEEKEETYNKHKKVNNVKKVNTKKSNNIKDYNKSQIPNDNVEIPKKEQKEPKKQKKSKFCFLCCLTNKLNDSDEL